MQRITIESTEVHTKTGTSQRTGKGYSIREQDAYLHTRKKYPVACRIPLGDEQEPYAPGDYDIASPLTVGRFDSLVVNRDLGLKLIAARPVRAAANA